MQRRSLKFKFQWASCRPTGAYAEPLAKLGYIHAPHLDQVGCPFFHRPLESPHTHHVHVVPFGGAGKRRQLAFRDFLREHNDVAQEYATLKKQLAAEVEAADASARGAYANAKTQFIGRVVQIALAAGYSHRERRIGVHPLATRPLVDRFALQQVGAAVNRYWTPIPRVAKTSPTL